MKRLLKFPLIEVLVVLLAFVVIQLAIPRSLATSKRVVEQNCTVVADLRADEIAAEVKKLNKKGIRVQETQIRVVDGKFTIIILDGQDDPEDEEDPENGSPAIDK